MPLPELCADVVIAAGWRPTLRSRIRRLVESVRVMVDAGVQGWDEGDDPRGRQR